MFAIGYVVCFPFFALGLRYLSNHRSLIRLSMRCSQLWFVCSALRWRIRYEKELKVGQSYVFCANHNSYLDVPSIFLTNQPLVFVGKSALAHIPLFGYMYRRMHIMVNRDNLRSRYNVLEAAQAALKENKSLVFFPEGGIHSKYPPCLAPFKKGAFRVAITSQVPIVPITIMYNWMIMPKYARQPPYRPYTHRVELLIHTPISTQNLREEDEHLLMKQVRARIEQPLRKTFPTLFTELNDRATT